MVAVYLETFHCLEDLLFTLHFGTSLLDTPPKPLHGRRLRDYSFTLVLIRPAGYLNPPVIDIRSNLVIAGGKGSRFPIQRDFLHNRTFGAFLWLK